MDKINMSKKEREQLVVFEKLKTGEITQKEAGLRLGISTRWVRIKYKRYAASGARGLSHKGRGRASPRRWDTKEEAFMITLLQNDWYEFGPTFTAEKLLELHLIKVSKETVRKAMIKSGLWYLKKQKRKHRQWRERRPIFGLMTQLDGSPHDWFEGRGQRCTLLVFIDDASSRVLWLQFVESESLLEVLEATKNYVVLYGIPHEMYVDFGSVFSVNVNNADRTKKTNWENAVASLGIKVLHAHSPQAKGRVERVHGTLQDRLVKEMRLAGVSSIEEANRFLRETNFVAKHNQRFAVQPQQKGDAHKPTIGYDLNKVFCVKEDRVVTNDYTVHFNSRMFQLTKSLSVRPKDCVTINTHLDGSNTITIRRINLEFEEIKHRPLKKEVQEEEIRPYKHFKPGKSSKRWNSGLLPILPQLKHAGE